MSDEVNNPNGQPQSEGQVESRQPNYAPGESGDRRAPSDTPLNEQHSTDQGSSDYAANPAETTKESKEVPAGGNTDNQRGELDEPAAPEFADLEPSPLEKLVDALALMAHDVELGAGTERYVLSEDGFAPMIDLMRESPGGQIYVSLVEWDYPEPKLSQRPQIEYGGRQHSIPTMPRGLYESLLLPTKLTDYGTTRQLFESIQALLRKYLMLSEEQSALLSYWCIATWFPEFLDFIPRLTITGSRFAADLLLRVLQYVCRRPVLLAGMNSAVLRAIPFAELRPTLLIRQTRLSKRTAELLDASDRDGYFVATGKDLWQCYTARCIYLGEDYSQQVLVPDGIHVHLARNAVSARAPVPGDGDAQDLQNKLFRYRVFNRELVQSSMFKASSGLQPELRAVAQQLGAAIVDDTGLQKRVTQLLQGQNEQARVDRAYGLGALVLRAVLFHCHQPDLQQVFVRDVAITVNDIYRTEGESLKVSNETVGHVLKNLGLYTRRLGSAGRGLKLDKATRSLAHKLGDANEVLPDSSELPACGYCHHLQTIRTS